MGVIFISGVYGVGKTTISNNLSKSLNIPYFDQTSEKSSL
jgi:shikimate kinase